VTESGSIDLIRVRQIWGTSVKKSNKRGRAGKGGGGLTITDKYPERKKKTERRQEKRTEPPRPNFPDWRKRLHTTSFLAEKKVAWKRRRPEL